MNDRPMPRDLPVADPSPPSPRPAPDTLAIGLLLAILLFGIPLLTYCVLASG